MNAQGFGAPLRLVFRPSRRLVGLIAFTHLGAAILLSQLQWPLWLLLCAVLLILVHGVRALRRQALFNARGAVRGLLRDGSGNWRLLTDSRERPVTLDHDAYIHRQLVVLAFAEQGKWATEVVTVLPDMLDADQFRRLRVCLRYPTGGPAAA